MNRFTRSALGGLALAVAGGAAAETTLKIESWRVDDKDLWEDTLIPAFEQSHPEIKLKFVPTTPTEYDSSVRARLEGNTGGDIITCRAFDQSLALYKRGHLMALNGKPGMEHFPDSAKVAWQTDDGDTTYCMPVASVIHGFFYNKAIFEELGLEKPGTVKEFFAVLDELEASSYAPIALGTADQWETHQVVFTGIGPNYWHGEEGRKALLAGEAEFTDPQFVAVWEQLERWREYLPRGYQAQSYADSQNLFALGRAAIYPGGSWDISYFNDNALQDFGAFAPPVPEAGDQCYISDHTDMGMGINAGSEHKTEALAFLEWVASREFAELYANNVTGFFPLSDHTIDIQDPVAAEMVSWREDCQSTIRLNAQIMNRGDPNMESAMWVTHSRLLNGKIDAEKAASVIQQGFEHWYEPQQDGGS